MIHNKISRRATLLLATFTIFAISLATSCSCSSSSEDDTVKRSSLPRDITEKLMEHGRNDAKKAMEYPEDSFERANALLYIRATESKLRAKGLKQSADIYIHGANQVINQHQEAHE